MSEQLTIRLPNITGTTAEAKVQQMQSYMYQLVEQLNWALNVVTDAQNGDTTDVVLSDAQIAAAEQEAAGNTFNSIKSLIIKSADIVNAYYDEMKQSFDGVYAAQSDFGEFKQETNMTLTQTSTAMNQIYTNVQEVTSNVSDIQSSMASTSAYIRTGVLVYDSTGIPVYGVEVGQTDTIDGTEVFNRYSRFTSEGIYFYLPGSSTPIAWMSGTKLYITNAELTGTLKLGKYMMDASDGIAFVWYGG